MAGNPYAKYGLTKNGYDSLVKLQNGACATCKRTPAELKGRKLVVDHDHATGAVRGALCGACNTAIGMVREKHEVLDAIAKYLGYGGVPGASQFQHTKEELKSYHLLSDIASLFSANNRLQRVKVGDIEVSFGPEAAPARVVLHQPVQAQPPITPDKPIPEAPLNDADLVLDVPQGMLVPQPLPEDSN